MDHLRSTVETLHVTRADAGVVRSDMWHLTLAFLGEVTDPEMVRDRVAECAADKIHLMRSTANAYDSLADWPVPPQGPCLNLEPAQGDAADRAGGRRV
ncbi:2'-5' RNA ligase family protein [Cryptosporangium arvum]|uniref:2',5' RNA ligase family protein n=1 Tax=Cryptosporangium arvum DSM 44712 TaxID=927661 RepID=A0A010YWK9_9ACTN|nr:2'-5' RNA ligase family protein [Cryptosporangium arvum]EXG79538.1 2',5' RNA ligase family protein [Cryptosporangium arvum DSM 44712]